MQEISWLINKLSASQDRLCPIYKKKILLVIYIDTKASADCAQRWGKIKDVIKIYESYVH
jgi:hypothetical protein